MDKLWITFRKNHNINTSKSDVVENGGELSTGYQQGETCRTPSFRPGEGAENPRDGDPRGQRIPAAGAQGEAQGLRELTAARSRGGEGFN